MKKNYNFLALLLVLILVLSGCYRNKLVESNQVGLKMSDGVSIDSVVGPGRYTENGWWADMTTINASNITMTWNDPSLVTSDKQPIGLTLAVTFARKRDSENVKKLYTEYNGEAKDDAVLQTLVASKIPGVAKTITTKYTLDQMLGLTEPISGTAAIDRGVVAREVFDLLKDELDSVYIQLTAVEISDIAPSPSFMAALDAKAKAQIDTEVAQEQTKLITEQLQQEKATTQIELEKASRDNLVNEQKAKAYEQSPQLLQLKMMELTASMLKSTDTIIYVPEGSDITSVLMGQQGQIVPVK